MLPRAAVQKKQSCFFRRNDTQKCQKLTEHCLEQDSPNSSNTTATGSVPKPNLFVPFFFCFPSKHFCHTSFRSAPSAGGSRLRNGGTLRESAAARPVRQLPGGQAGRARQATRLSSLLQLRPTREARWLRTPLLGVNPGHVPRNEPTPSKQG